MQNLIAYNVLLYWQEKFWSNYKWNNIWKYIYIYIQFIYFLINYKNNKSLSMAIYLYTCTWFAQCLLFLLEIMNQDGFLTNRILRPLALVHNIDGLILFGHVDHLWKASPRWLQNSKTIRNISPRAVWYWFFCFSWDMNQ